MSIFVCLRELQRGGTADGDDVNGAADGGSVHGRHSFDGGSHVKNMTSSIGPIGTFPALSLSLSLSVSLFLARPARIDQL